MRLGLALPVGLIECFHDVAADVHGETVEVVAGIQQAHVGRHQPVELGQHPECGQAPDGLAARAQDRIGQVAIGAGVARAVDVEQPALAVEVQDDQLVAGLLQVGHVAPAHARVVLDDEPGDRSVRAGRDGVAEQPVRPVHGGRLLGVPLRGRGAMRDRAHLRFQQADGHIIGRAGKRPLERAQLLHGVGGAFGDVTEQQVPIGVLAEQVAQR